MTDLRWTLPLFVLSLLGAAEEGTDWTGWRGPDGSGTSADTGVAMIDAADQAKLVWNSDLRIPGTYEGDARKPQARPEARIPGGYGSPIVAGDKVYLYYYLPHGPADGFATAIRDKHVGGNGVGREKWYSDADDVIHCFDAATGKTLWKRVFVERGFNLEGGFNKGGGQFTPAVADGRVYALGTSGHVYCVDAATGHDIWQNDTGIRARYVEILKDGWRDRDKLAGGRNDFGGCLMVSGGTVAVSDHQEFKGGPRTMGKSNGLVGFDAATGLLKWYAAGAGGSGMLTTTPLAWSHEGKNYFLTDGIDGLLLVDAESGAILWSVAGGKIGNAGAVSGTTLVASINEPEAKHLACFDLSPSGATLRWKVGEPSGSMAPVIYQGHVYAGSKAGIRCIDLTDGSVKATAEQESISGSLVGADGRLVCAASSRGKAGMSIFKIGDGQITALGKAPHGFANSTTAAISKGLVYVRARDRLQCIDLRK